MAAAFPNAKTIKAARFDDYFEQLQAPAVKSQLPVVDSEVGDSWLYGCGSDPLKVQTMALLGRHHDTCVTDPACVNAEPGFQNFQRLLILAGKHTCNFTSNRRFALLVMPVPMLTDEFLVTLRGRAHNHLG